MAEIQFLKDYQKRFNFDLSLSLPEYIDILTNHIERLDVDSKEHLCFTDNNGEKHVLACVKKYFNVPGKKKIAGINPNTLDTPYNECVKVKRNFLPEDDPVRETIYWCAGCHCSCINQFLSGKLERRNS